MERPGGCDALFGGLFYISHNTSFQGSLKDHCLYERDLKHQLRGYVKTPEARCVFHIQKLEAGRCRDEQELFEYIQESHRRYMQEEHSPLEDCRWIARLCSRVFMSVICWRKIRHTRRFRKLLRRAPETA